MYGDLPPIQLTGSSETINGFPVLIESTPTGPKTAVLRLPTTDELLDYLRVQKSRYKDLGRRKSESEEIPNPKADQKLFRSIRLDSGPEFDDAEAARAIGLITRHRVTDCTRDGDSYIITVSTPFGSTTHTVRMPYESERAEYFRSFLKETDLPHGITERRFPPDVPVKLYDKIVLTADGYQSVFDSPAKVVPPHHKRSVINELFSTLAALDPDLDPNS